MGKALQEGGLYYLSGVAVDSEGKAVKGAPPRSANTVTVDQPASIANVSVVDLVKALRAPAEVARQPDRK
jgi:hypothetical protein